MEFGVSTVAFLTKEILRNYFRNQIKSRNWESTTTPATHTDKIWIWDQSSQPSLLSSLDKYSSVSDFSHLLYKRIHTVS